jgi:hypothetical protein
MIMGAATAALADSAVFKNLRRGNWVTFFDMSALLI